MEKKKKKRKQRRPRKPPDKRTKTEETHQTKDEQEEASNGIVPRDTNREENYTTTQQYVQGRTFKRTKSKAKQQG